MKNGFSRFEFYLTQLEQMVLKASGNTNPALWLYSNNARTPLFMLEGLSKLYGGIHNKKKFGKLKEHFKLLEDGIGSIDYYDNLAKDLANDTRVPATVKEYLQGQAREKIQRLNDLLQENNWIGENASRISKIRKKLLEADWQEPKQEIKSIRTYYGKEIEEIRKFWSDCDRKFTEMEAQVHEIRRMMRWLSIYPQALQGLIQLQDSGMRDADTDKYLTPEVVQSPYNKMPASGINETVLYFEQQYFLSLSWMIAKLGSIKDDGLCLMAVAEALQQTESLSHKEAMNRACDIFGGNRQLPADILQEASAICTTFFKEKILEKLIPGNAEEK